MNLRNIGITLFLFLACALAWALPPHLMGRITEHYPETTWQWLGDAIWNAQPLVSIPLVMVLAFFFGRYVPKLWYLALPAAWWIDALNFLLDVNQYPTSHNLWPLELAGFGVINLPVLGAAWLGQYLNRKSEGASVHHRIVVRPAG